MIDVVKAKANSDVSFEELEIKRYVKETETFIDKTNNVKNTEKADSDAEGDLEAKDDPRVVLGSVQERVHVVARFAGCGVSPPNICPA